MDKYKQLLYFFCILFIFIFISKFIFANNILYNSEYFTTKNKINNSCLFEMDGNTISCKNNSDKKCINCGYERPNLHYQINPECCKNKCLNHKELLNKIPISNMIGVTGLKKYIKKPYWWCKNKYTCFIRNQTLNGKAWCGIDNLTNQISNIYSSKEQCFKSIDPYKNLNKCECLKQEGAGWCTDRNGKGICVEGGKDRPADLVRYNYCFPNRDNIGTNSYSPGNANPFIVP